MALRAVFHNFDFLEENTRHFGLHSVQLLSITKGLTLLGLEIKGRDASAFYLNNSQCLVKASPLSKWGRVTFEANFG